MIRIIDFHLFKVDDRDLVPNQKINFGVVELEQIIEDIDFDHEKRVLPTGLVVADFHFILDEEFLVSDADPVDNFLQSGVKVSAFGFIYIVQFWGLGHAVENLLLIGVAFYVSQSEAGSEERVDALAVLNQRVVFQFWAQQFDVPLHGLHSVLILVFLI